MTEPGTYIAIATGDVEKGRTKNKATPFVRAKFRILEGRCKGDVIPWTGWMTERARPYTEKALRTAGWGGDWDNMTLDTQVEIVTEIEDYNGRKYPRVRYVNELPPELFSAGIKEPIDDIPF